MFHLFHGRVARVRFRQMFGGLACLTCQPLEGGLKGTLRGLCSDPRSDTESIVDFMLVAEGLGAECLDDF